MKLSNGEKALINALRKVEIKRVNCDDPTKWTYLLTNKEVFRADVVVRVESESDEECNAIADAIFMIKVERMK